MSQMILDHLALNTRILPSPVKIVPVLHGGCPAPGGDIPAVVDELSSSSRLRALSHRLSWICAGWRLRFRFSEFVAFFGVSLLSFRKHLVMTVGLCPSCSYYPICWGLTIRSTEKVFGVFPSVPAEARRNTSYAFLPSVKGTGGGMFSVALKWGFRISRMVLTSDFLPFMEDVRLRASLGTVMDSMIAGTRQQAWLKTIFP